MTLETKDPISKEDLKPFLEKFSTLGDRWTNIIMVSDFLKDDEVFHVVNGVNFQFGEKGLGLEIPNFEWVPDYYDAVFSKILSVNVKTTPDSGYFRKSFPIIHFENFHEKSIFTGVIALEDVIYRTWQHKETNELTALDSANAHNFIIANCGDEDKWHLINRVFIPRRSIFFFHPFVWHSFTPGIIQMFHLERKVENET